MRTSDSSRLSQPFEGNGSPDQQTVSALGVDTPHWTQLTSMIFDDLTPEPPYGIGWWAPHPGTKKRIFISDYLYACATSVPKNMIDAGLHWLELLDHIERDNARIADAVSRDQQGRWRISQPDPECPMDTLRSRLIDAHVAGLVLALYAALDCMAATIVGVTALPTSILFADLKGVRGVLSRLPDTVTIQSDFGAALDRNIKSSGPEGWLEWTLDYRNMLVHRGRRVHHGQLVPRDSGVLGPDGRRIVRTGRVTCRPSAPARSDIEVLANPEQPFLLSEDLVQTLGGIRDSVKQLLDLTARALITVWLERKRNPPAVPQPKEQWKEGRPTNSPDFAGYRPGTHPINLTPSSVWLMHPEMVRRLKAAAVDDQSRGNWSKFD